MAKQSFSGALLCVTLLPIFIEPLNRVRPGSHFRIRTGPFGRSLIGGLVALVEPVVADVDQVPEPEVRDRRGGPADIRYALPEAFARQIAGGVVHDQESAGYDQRAVRRDVRGGHLEGMVAVDIDQMEGFLAGLGDDPRFVGQPPDRLDGF